MASSFQAFPPPLAVYPTTETNQPETSYRTGSYGTVFVVLGVIIVVSAIACVLGRLCSKRSKRSSDKLPKSSKNKHHSHDHNHGHSRDHNNYKAPPHSNGRSKERDIELGFGPNGRDFEMGFDKKIPKAKVAPNGHGRGQRPPQHGQAQFGGRQMAHHQLGVNPMLHKQQLPMMECPRGFE